MPSSSKKSYGLIPKERVKNLLKALLEGVAGQRGLSSSEYLKSDWSNDEKTLKIETTLRAILQLSHPELTSNTQEFKQAKTQAGEALKDLRDFVCILDDHRVQKRGSGKWHFSLRLWGQDIDRNLNEFDKLWEIKRSLASKQSDITAIQPTPSLKPAAPFPRVRLPDYFVERPDALNDVKKLLLGECKQTPNVTVIAGLGGLGKSLLATAVLLDKAVQEQFEDGILWVTIGQEPDVLTLLGDCIRELDKSRENFSTTTKESASQHLNSLLLDRRILLVVDDVWNASHAEWFRVGGSGCRVLVTTREAQIDGAEYLPLDLMTEEEAISLVKKKLGQQYRTEEEAEIKIFANMVGRLPLALDLSANQVRDGVSWADLRGEFEAERQSVVFGTGQRSGALKLLDSPEAWHLLDENEQRKYSLQACFNLSLKRLNPEQKKQFAWLGVLPEDVNLSTQVAEVLWNLPSVYAKKGLSLLRQRSFLTDGVATDKDQQIYRVHDLMHDMARSLIQEGTLKPEISDLPSAHRQFLECYRKRASNHCWQGLPDDGYIHAHLTQHFVQSGQPDEVHRLLQESTPEGKNAWYEACDRLSQTAIFVTDVTRAWELAELIYEKNASHSIALQCRYALIISSLNSIVRYIPTQLFETLAKTAYWTPAQCFSHALQIKEPSSKGNAIISIIPYLPEDFISVVHQVSYQIGSNSARAKILCTLSRRDPRIFAEAYQVADGLQEGGEKAQILIDLAGIENHLLPKAIEAIYKVPLNGGRAYLLSKIAHLNSEILNDIIQIISESRQKFSASGQKNDELYCLDQEMDVMCELAHHDSRWLPNALQATLNNPWGYRPSKILSRLPSIDTKLLPFIHQEICKIQDIKLRAECLCELSSLDIALFDEAYQTTLRIEPESERKIALSLLAQHHPKLIGDALKVSKLTDDRFFLIEILIQLNRKNEHFIAEILELTLSSEYESSRANILIKLAKNIPLLLLSKVFKATDDIKSPTERARVLTAIAKRDNQFMSSALQAIRAISVSQDSYWKASFFVELFQDDEQLFLETLDAICNTQNNGHQSSLLNQFILKVPKAVLNQVLEIVQNNLSISDQAGILSDLACREPHFLSNALGLIRMMPSGIGKARCLRNLAAQYQHIIDEALQATLEVDQEEHKVDGLIELATIDRKLFSKAFEAALRLKDPVTKAHQLIRLAELDLAALNDALEAIYSIQDEFQQAIKLNRISKKYLSFFQKALEAIRKIHDQYDRARAFSDLTPQIISNGIDFALWTEVLRNIANQERRQLLRNMPTLEIAIVSLGGTEAMKEVVKAMKDVYNWWL